MDTFYTTNEQPYVLISTSILDIICNNICFFKECDIKNNTYNYSYVCILHIFGDIFLFTNMIASFLFY